MNCPECDKEMGDPEGKTYSNVENTKYPNPHYTGDIYYCEDCQYYWLHDLFYKTINRYSG